MKIKLGRRQIAAFILAASLLALNSTMRYGIWKKMQGYNVDKTRYEKLALANHLKGREGLNYELQNLAKHDATAKDFVAKTAEQLSYAKDARAFIKASIAHDREHIDNLKQKRFWISCFIYLILACQVSLNVYVWCKDNRPQWLPFAKK